jgi:N-acetylmuramoyl-L-alanine amidase
MRIGRIATPLLAALLPGLLATGCTAAARFERSRLPPGVQGSKPNMSTEHAMAIDEERVRLTKEYLRIHNPELAAELPAADVAESISFEPRLVVVHFTAIPTLGETLETFEKLHIGSDRELIRRNGLLNVGIQFVVDRDGTIYALYPENVIARHVIGLNHVALGIENVGDGDLRSRRAEASLTEAQLEANVALVRYLTDRHLSIEYMIGHSEYRQLERRSHPAHDLFHEELPAYRTEKSDPGRRFMKRLRRMLRQSAGKPVG